jgi:hypothetical protein
VSIVDTLNQIWTTILDVTSIFVMPDWNLLVQLLPFMILVGVIGPFITFTILGSLIYLARRPRTKVTFVEGPQRAQIGADGQPIFPPGLPHCRRDALIFTTGTNRCDTCRDELTVICPMCGLGRLAIVDTCTNCGLVLKVKPKAIAVRSTAGAKPGGAAAA